MEMDGVAQNGGEDVVLTHPVRAVRRPLNLIVSLSHFVVFQADNISIALVSTSVMRRIPSVR